VRFADKERHQIFIEPEGLDTNEMYVQGMSTSMPHDIQRDMYRSISGLENAEIMRYAYAIEYDCIDTLDVYPTLEFKKLEGLYTAGQVNGTSGYEEAAAQGLIAGINAAFKIMKKPPLILGRDESYIGVMIDDLVTKGTEEPYRIMTSRAEYRIILRQDTADFRLTPKVLGTGLVSKEREYALTNRKNSYQKALSFLDTRAENKEAEKFLKAHSIAGTTPLTYADLIRRGANIFDIVEEFNILSDISRDILRSAETTIKYEGYIKKNREQIEKAKKLDEKPLPKDINYDEIQGLRIEAREQLKRVRPLTLGQAGRIYGVNPADVTVLIVWLAMNKK
jgi:tRNA uridine 5-carboxymethylaminomethyl modification enzyme